MKNDIKSSLSSYYLYTYSFITILLAVLCIMQTIELTHPFLAKSDGLPSFIIFMVIGTAVTLLTPLGRLKKSPDGRYANAYGKPQSKGLESSFGIWGILQMGVCIIASLQASYHIFPESAWLPIGIAIIAFNVALVAMAFWGKFTVKLTTTDR